jgi:hypothetical protein
MLRFIAEVKEALQVMGYELELGVSRPRAPHPRGTHVGHHAGHHAGHPARPHSHLVSMVAGETEF